MKNLFIFFSIFMLLTSCQSDAIHPHIFADDTDKASIRQMIADEEWASMVFQRLRDKVEPYADRHVSDPEWLVSEVSGEVSQLYMVNARKIKQGPYAIKADEPVSASIYRENGKWYYSSTGEATVILRGKSFAVNEGYGKEIIVD